MYIKQIIIQGFKSYKDQMVIEPFSPGTNVVVGRNGSGKSNFFAAIRFVLSDAYTQLSREERQALLHEGSGSAVMSAYVEIIFDNSDNRFPTDHKEVVLRRTISLKKDEYSIDKKVNTLKEVNQFLESAGFSKSNPYYIVPQGRVTALTNMRESERLTLLKEVAGTQVYEARRAESLKIMTDTDNKRGKIDELLDYIKERLAELEEEKEELRGYQDKDRERRCLEYAYYHKEQVAVQEALEELDDARQGGMEDADENREAYTAGEKVIAQLDAEIHKLQQQMELLRIDRRQLDEDRRDGAKARAKAELAVKSLSDSMSAQDQAKQQHDAELNQVRKAIASKETELARILPEYEKRKREEARIKQELDSAEASRQRLFTKQTRSSQFRNKGERDAYLKKEINDLSMTLSQQKANRLDAEEEVKNIEASIKQLEKDVADLRAKNEGFGDSRKSLADDKTDAQDTLDKLQEERKSLRREEDKLDTILSNARREKDQAERELSHTMDGETSRGLATIRRLKAENDIPGAYGTLAELMEVSEAYRIPVEQVAGASLFHYVVDSEETATYFMNALQRTRGGRVTFAPLSKLRSRPANLPRANDAVPLITKIKYNPEFDAAFQQVFGRTIICPNLTVAGQYARSHNCDAITPEGDTTNKRGAMTGGFIDSRKSRLQAVQNATEWRNKYEQLQNEFQNIRKQMEKKEQEVTHATGEVRKREQKLRQMDDGYGPLRVELSAKTSQISREQDRLEAAIKRRDAVDRNMKDFSDTLAAHEAELASDFKKALTADEEQQMETLGQSVQDLQKQWTEISRGRRELEGRKQILDVELRSNLQLKLDQLTSQGFETSSGGSRGNLKEAQRELKKAQNAVASIEARIKENEQEIETTESNIAKLEKQKSAKDVEQQELAKDIQKYQKRLEKSVQKKALLTTRATECAKNIRDLGVLPEEAFEKYERLESKNVSPLHLPYMMISIQH
ncbi:condensin complex component SMC3 [Truncatella angustata]|uniref:Condensin complex component SMC3 n=1 Tax=Truncatella angustata TaxID=152316 RepID=A0A9P9A5A3_9PEZI|nr:condensin complex component SMC3 [Truncatella angustata]KAH6661115.1 condensin complex component SMC3 [Truncatella angustata]